MQPHIILPPVYEWNICVMTKGETWFANTEGHVKSFATIAPGSFHDAGKLLTQISAAFGDRKEGLLLIPILPGGGDDEDGLPATTSLAWRWSRVEAAAERAGWKITGDAERIRDNGWATFRHLTTGRKIFMGVLPFMGQERTPLFSLDDGPEAIIKALITYASVTGVLWRMTAGVSGCASIRHDRAARAARQLSLVGAEQHDDEGEPFWNWAARPDELHGAGRIIWSRPLVDAERHGKIATYDVRAQHLATMQSARYGWGRPAQRLRVPFDPERAGFWLVAASGLLALDGPPLVRHIDSRGLTWVTTPVLVYLREQGIEPLVYDSWTSATSSQILRPWAQKLRNAIYQSESSALRLIEPALKSTYADTNGMFRARGGSIDRIDWHWTTVDGSTMNLRRKIDNARRVMGMWPCEIYHDAVSYPVADAEEFAALNNALGVVYPARTQPIQIGKFKYIKAEPIEVWEARQAFRARRTSNA